MSHAVLFDVLFERRKIGENRLYVELTAIVSIASIAVVDTDLLGDRVVTPK